MARKSLGFVNLIWTCPSCGTENPGPIKTCTACGAPQPADVQFNKVDSAKFDLIKDEALIRMAKAGPDIHCPYCGTRNSSQAALCSNCGGELAAGGKARQSGTVVGATTDQPPAPPAAPAKKMSKGCIFALIFIAIIAVVLTIVLISLSSKTNTITAQVSALSWQRSIDIEGYVAVEQKAWHDEIPAGAETTTCTQQYRYTADEPVANATEVCGTEYVEDTGTGIGEVVQDCHYEVYEDYCSYYAFAWAVVDQAVASGSDLDATWPSTSLTTDQRLGEENETYTITFNSDGKTYTYTTSDYTLYQKAKPGSTWQLEVNALGGIREILLID